MQSIKTEGAVAAFVLQMFGALLCEALAVFEAENEAAEAGPASLRRAA